LANNEGIFLKEGSDWLCRAGGARGGRRLCVFRGRGPFKAAQGPKAGQVGSPAVIRSSPVIGCCHMFLSCHWVLPYVALLSFNMEFLMRSIEYGVSSEKC
jgi:hypothetical protein